MSRLLKRNLLVLAALLLAAMQPLKAAPDMDADPTLGQRTQQRTFQSQAMSSEMSFDLYIPEAYEQEPERRFPIVYWLHGGGGFPPGVVGVLAERFDSAIRAGKIPAMLVVFPHDGHGRNMWVDSKDGAIRMESFVVGELVPHIDANYRTVGAARGRILEGGSMGGYGAARLGFKYPEVFGAVSMLNAGPLQEVLDPQDAPTAGPTTAQATLDRVYGGDPEYFRSQSPWVLAEQNAAAIRSKVAVRQIIGAQDALLENNRRFSEHLTALKIPHAFEVLQGVSHGSPRATFAALGESYWEFFRDVLEGSGGVSGEAKADPANAERSALIALERESHHWWLEGNTEALTELFAEDYRFVAPNGAVEDKAWVTGTDPDSVRMLQVESMRMEPEEVILSGNRAIVLGVIEMKATVAGRPAPERLRVLSVFERSDAEADWRLAARSTTPVRRPPAAPN